MKLLRISFCFRKCETRIELGNRITFHDMVGGNVHLLLNLIFRTDIGSNKRSKLILEELCLESAFLSRDEHEACKTDRSQRDSCPSRVPVIETSSRSPP